MESQVLYRIYKNPVMVPALSHMNPVYITTYFKIYFNIIRSQMSSILN
jgi:hypothetical protein